MGRPKAAERSWPLWEVFVPPGSAACRTSTSALAARPGRPRWCCATAATSTPAASEGVSLWWRGDYFLSPASSPDERDSFFDPAADKVYRHPTFYDVPEDVEYL